MESVSVVLNVLWIPDTQGLYSMALLCNLPLASIQHILIIPHQPEFIIMVYFFLGKKDYRNNWTRQKWGKHEEIKEKKKGCKNDSRYEAMMKIQ